MVRIRSSDRTRQVAPFYPFVLELAYSLVLETKGRKLMWDRCPPNGPIYLGVMEVGIHQSLKKIGPKGIARSWLAAETILVGSSNGRTVGFISRIALD